MTASVTSSSAMRGQAVHEDRMRRRARHQRVVHLVGRKISAALGRFVLLTHAGPGIGVDRIHAGHRCLRIGETFDDRAGLLRQCLCASATICGLRLVALRRRDANRRSEASAVSSSECATLLPSPT